VADGVFRGLEGAGQLTAGNRFVGLALFRLPLGRPVPLLVAWDLFLRCELKRLSANFHLQHVSRLQAELSEYRLRDRDLVSSADACKGHWTLSALPRLLSR
jgi:hypothetical protein